MKTWNNHIKENDTDMHISFCAIFNVIMIIHVNAVSSNHYERRMSINHE